MTRTHTFSDSDALYVGIDRTIAGVRERYLIRFDERSRDAALQTLSRWAGDKGLSFNWYDAASLAKSVRSV